MNFTNTTRDVYHEYGFKVAVNAVRPIQSGSLNPVLRAKTNIPGDHEILFSYGKSIVMPKTYEEEQFGRIGGRDVPNMWPYPFTRQSVIDHLVSFQDRNREKYERALALVSTAIHDAKRNAVVATHSTGKFSSIELLNEDISRCKAVPSNKSLHNEVS